MGVKTSMFFHVVAAIPGIFLSGVALYRYRRHWPAGAAPNGAQPTQARKLLWDYRALACYLLLAATGFGIALLIIEGAMFLLALVAVGMVYIPWAKISVCRPLLSYVRANRS